MFTTYSNFTIKHGLGLFFISLQLIAFVYAKFNDSRYFCWAPYDMHTHYTIKVVIQEQTLSSEEIAQRYRINANGFNPRSYREILGAIEQYETTYGKSDEAVVSVIYSVNGHEPSYWNFPQ